MLTDSVITRSGQLWKLIAGVALLLFGSIAPLFEGLGISWTVGTIVAGIGYVFALAFIVCPACSSRWLWQATLDARLYKPVFKQPDCPACQEDFGAAP